MYFRNLNLIWSQWWRRLTSSSLLFYLFLTFLCIFMLVSLLPVTPFKTKASVCCCMTVSEGNTSWFLFESMREEEETGLGSFCDASMIFRFVSVVVEDHRFKEPLLNPKPPVKHSLLQVTMRSVTQTLTPSLQVLVYWFDKWLMISFSVFVFTWNKTNLYWNHSLDMCNKNKDKSTKIETIKIE